MKIIVLAIVWVVFFRIMLFYFMKSDKNLISSTPYAFQTIKSSLGFKMFQIVMIIGGLYIIVELITMGWIGWLVLVPFVFVSYITWKKWKHNLQ